MEVAEFTVACRQISELNLSPAVAEHAHRAVAEEMTARYALPFPGGVEQTFGPARDTARNRRGQWHELVQHLTDLAYLSPEQFRWWHAFRAADDPPSADLMGAVLVAAGQFVAEDDPAAYVVVEDFPPRLRVMQLQWVERYLPLLIFRISRYTSFDGELEVQADYRVGERGAYGRSLAFRIRVYFHDYLDRRSARRKAYFDADLLPFLHSLNNSLQGTLHDLLPRAGAERLHAELHRLLLDAGHLFRVFREHHRMLEGSGGRYFLVYELEEDSTVGREEELDRRTERLRRRAGRQLSREEVHVDTGHNRLGVRLLQLGLWRAGFYTGVLDGAFGPLSHAALLGLIGQEQEASNPVLNRRQLARLLVRGADSAAYVVDLRGFGRLLDAYAPPPEAVAREEETVLWNHIAEAGLEKQLDDRFVEREAMLKEAFGEQQRHPDRRVYYGLRGLIRGAFRAAGRVLRWIAGAIGEVLGAVFDFAKSLVKRIQEGVSLFFEGFRYLSHYLLGRPFFSLGQAVNGVHPLMSTRFGLGFDAVSLADAGASVDDLRRHANELRRMGEGIDYFMGVATSLIRYIGALASPGGWLRLGVAIARWVRQWLRGEGNRGAVTA